MTNHKDIPLFKHIGDSMEDCWCKFATDPTPEAETGGELREILAAIEHERWADWQKWMHSRMTDTLVNGIPVFTIPVEYVVRWQRQIQTPYSKLSNQEKASDMEQVDRYWPLIAAHTRRAVLLGKLEELRELKTIDKFGFERLNLVVEYEDGTNSGVIPYRQHWNDCYDRFVVTIDDRIKALEAELKEIDG